MNEWWSFIIVAGCLILLTSLILIYPLKKSNKIFLIVPISIVFNIAAYYWWGEVHMWRKHLEHRERLSMAQETLKQIKSPEQLILMLKNKLDDNPQSAQGWYLLGKLYNDQGQLQEALYAFTKAHQLKPAHELYTVYYAYGLWQINKQQFNPEIATVFKKLLANNPTQPDALAMLAMNAYQTHHYQEAIDYWRQLLQLTSPQSKEALALRKAIAQAQRQLLAVQKN